MVRPTDSKCCQSSLKIQSTPVRRALDSKGTKTLSCVSFAVIDSDLWNGKHGQKGVATQFIQSH